MPVLIENSEVSVDVLAPEVRSITLTYGHLKRTYNPLKDILFAFNAQHDCSHAKCAVSTTVSAVQERHVTSRTQPTLVHNMASKRYFVNLHAIHNAALVRSTLPPDLTRPKPLFQDRTVRHRAFAAGLRSVHVHPVPATVPETIDRLPSDLPPDDPISVPADDATASSL